MIKLLSIGNSFSQDVTRYLYGIARADGVEMKIVNLYIGGCSLSRHYRNMLSEGREYSYELNGMKSGLWVSMKEALLSDEWDYVTIQQQSLKSTDYETFVPYLDALAAYVRKMAPMAKILLHQTWGYEPLSQKLIESPFETHEEMFAQIREAYAKAADAIDADGILCSGETVLLANQIGAPCPYRDGFHLSKGFGRYLCGLVWYAMLTGNDPISNPFDDFDVELSEDAVNQAKQIAAEIVKKQKIN